MTGRDERTDPDSAHRGVHSALPMRCRPFLPIATTGFSIMSIASFALAQMPIGQALTPRQSGTKPPPKRSLTVTTDAIVIPEPR